MSRVRFTLFALTVAVGLWACGCTVVVDGGGGSTTPDANEDLTPDGNDGFTDDANEGLTPDEGDGTTPEGGPGAPTTLEAGRSNQSLSAGGRKTFRISAERGETLITNTSLPDSSTNVDMYAYAPDGQRPIASSENGAGRSDTLIFLADTTGDYTIEVVNISPSDAAQLSLDVQRIPPRAGVASTLNGVYRITEVDGVPTSGSSESWVFSNGQLASIYGVIAAEDLQAVGIDADEDARYWVDATTGEVCEVHLGEIDAAWRIVDTHTESDGSSVTVTFDQNVVYQGQGWSSESDQTITFEGGLLDGGDTLRGSSVTEVYGDRPFQMEASVKLERQEDAAAG